MRWLGDRQKAMNDALIYGNAGEVARMVVLRERGHQSVEAVDWAIWCRREWHASVHGGEHRPVSQKLRFQMWFGQMRS